MFVEIKRIKKQDCPVVTSLDIAETFGKEHTDVLNDIRNLECSGDFKQANFVQSSFFNAQNKKQTIYLITRDGFDLLVTGYSRDDVFKTIESYIRQFNAMETAVQDRLIERERNYAVRESIIKVLQTPADSVKYY